MGKCSGYRICGASKRVRGREQKTFRASNQPAQEGLYVDNTMNSYGRFCFEDYLIISFCYRVRSMPPTLSYMYLSKTNNPNASFRTNAIAFRVMKLKQGVQGFPPLSFEPVSSSDCGTIACRIGHSRQDPGCPVQGRPWDPLVVERLHRQP